MKIRYYAYDGVPGEWRIMTAAQWEEERGEPHDEQMTGIGEMHPYETLKEAKAYVRGHLQGDINDCRSRLSRVTAYRKGEDS